MESYLTLLSRLAVIAFVAFIVSAAVTPTTTRISHILSGTTAEPPPSVSDTPSDPIDGRLLTSVAIGTILFATASAGFCFFRLRKFQLAVDHINALGGNLNFIPNSSSLALRWLHSKTTLDLSDTDLADDNLPQFSALPRLESLRVASTSITDNAAQSISQCRYLKSLDISDTKFGDPAIMLISKLPSLETLIASQTLISDNSIESLTSINTLRNFECADTAISPEGLEQLDSLKSE